MADESADESADEQQPLRDPEERDPELATSPTDPADAATSTDPYATPPDPHEGAVPPGYDWPTHGGYLGCLMGLIAACLLAGFVGSFAIGLVSVTPLGVLVSTPFVRIALLVVSFVVCFGVLGRVGWVLGRRFYREYPQSGSSERVAGAPSSAESEKRRDHERVG